MAVLGGLPLALDQAGAFIEETQCGLQEYLRLYHLKRAEVLKLRGEGVFDDHPKPVATTWSLSFAAVEQRQKAAADLLRACTFLHPDAIPEELFGQGVVHLGPVLAAFATNPLTFNTAIATLNAYSLLRRNSTEKTLLVHRLVQAVLQDTMSEQERDLWRERVVMALDAVFPNSEPTTWIQCERLVPHALVCATSTQSWKSTNTDLASLLLKTANYLVDRAQYEQAEPLYQRSLLIWERAYGPEHPDVAYPLNGLANLYREQGKYEQAEPLFQRVLLIWEQAHGPEYLLVATPLNGLADLYRKQGKYEQAEPLFQRSLLIRERAYGPEHPDVATPLNGLAIIYREQGKYEQAEPLFQRALLIREQALGSDHPKTAEVMYDFALLQDAQGNRDEGKSLYEQALAIRVHVLGDNHPKTRETRKCYITLYIIYNHPGTTTWM